MDLIGAREAFDGGLTRYFTGKACKNGHVVERMISNGSCVSCLNEKSVERRKRDRADAYEATKVWRLKNPGARTEEARKYREKHPEKVRAKALAYRNRNLEECRARDREGARRMRALNPEGEKIRRMRHAKKVEDQKIKDAGRPRADKCELCGVEGKTVFDHCHEGGHFRGWICDRCNRVLGCVNDDTNLLQQMKDYLESNRGKDNCKTKESTP